MSFFLQRDSLTIKKALEMEHRTRLREGKGIEADSETKDVLESFDDTCFVNLQNGESRILF